MIFDFLIILFKNVYNLFEMYKNKLENISIKLIYTESRSINK